MTRLLRKSMMMGFSRSKADENLRHALENVIRLGDRKVGDEGVTNG